MGDRELSSKDEAEEADDVDEADDADSAEADDEPRKRRSRKRRSRLRRIGFWLAISLAGLFGLFVLLAGGSVAAFAIDGRVHSDKVLRNVTLSFDDDTSADIAIGGLSDDDLRQLLEDLATQHGARPVSWQLATEPQQTITATMSELDISIDVDGTLADALAAGRVGSFRSRLDQWFRAFSEPHVVAVRYSTNTSADSPALAGTQDLIVALPTDPKLSFASPTQPARLVPGQDGRIICASDITSRVISSADPRASQITVPPIPVTAVPTRFNNQTLRDSIDRINQATARGLATTSPSVSHQFAAPQVRGWLVIELDLPPPSVPAAELSCETLEQFNSNPTAELDVSLFNPPAVHADLERRYRDDIVPGEFGVITLLGDTPVAPNPEPGYRCCAAFDTDTILHTIFSDRDDATLDLPFRQDPELLPDFEADGKIKARVSEFTTMYEPDQSRVTNIQRFADLVRGVVIEPGDTFSLNDHVGRRTIENGFVSGGVIYNGRFVTDIGGGVSQFATTFFNAAFFAGLNFEEYMSHSLYLSRYPYGREATINYPDIDLVVRNITPYPILVWTSYDDTSITVDMYSSKWADVEQSDQVEVQEGSCVMVYTERTRTFPDGSQAIDRVTALYRPGVGLDCDDELEPAEPEEPAESAEPDFEGAQ